MRVWKIAERRRKGNCFIFIQGWARWAQKKIIQAYPPHDSSHRQPVRLRLGLLVVYPTLVSAFSQVPNWDSWGQAKMTLSKQPFRFLFSTIFYNFSKRLSVTQCETRGIEKVIEASTSGKWRPLTYQMFRSQSFCCSTFFLLLQLYLLRLLLAATQYHNRGP